MKIKHITLKTSDKEMTQNVKHHQNQIFQIAAIFTYMYIKIHVPI